MILKLEKRKVIYRVEQLGVLQRQKNSKMNSNGTFEINFSNAVTISICYAIIEVFGLCGNILVIFTVYRSHSLRSFVKYCFLHSKIKSHIFAPPCILLYILYTWYYINIIPCTVYSLWEIKCKIIPRFLLVLATKP
jgi:hypothetical protein